MTIQLNIREALPKIREAFDNKTLQMFVGWESGQDAPKATYSGPCAVGVCMTEEQRKYCDSLDIYSIRSFFDHRVVETPIEERVHFIDLQSMHDMAHLGANHPEAHEDRIKTFEEYLISLEKVYGAE